MPTYNFIFVVTVFVAKVVSSQKILERVFQVADI